MLHRRYTLDYGSKGAGSRTIQGTHRFHPLFFLDYISIIGRPLQPITQMSERFFDNMTISFQSWRAPYQSKHLYRLPFTLEDRTFRLASAATRETWFIVMHPIVAPAHEFPSVRESRQRKEQASRRSALQVHHAQALVAYIKDIFSAGELLGEGVEPSWVLGGLASQIITANKWTAFQTRFVEDWDRHVEQHSYDPFWRENQPAFHAYNYGANIEIEVTEELESLRRETRLRPDDESSESDAEGAEESAEESEGSDPPPEDDHEDDHALYTAGLQELRTELEGKYLLDHISSIDYALAVDLHAVDQAADQATCCLLADRNLVAHEYGRPRDFTFYPLAFHPAYGNFSSAKPPSFLANGVLAILQDNMSFQNDGGDVLSCGYFQGYSNIKRCIRHQPGDLLVTKGIATAALTLSTEGKVPARIQTKQRQLLGRLQGARTPDDPGASKPYARERRRVEQAIHEQEFAYRMEQVLSIDVSRLIPAQRHFHTILRPIFQLIRFYLQESTQYTHILRSFSPSVFPKVLGAFARMFELATDEMHRRFRVQGSKGLSVALSEGVAALDRLGNYCFTGLATALVPSVLRPLGTMDAIQNGAWPYLAPQMLDLHGDGQLNLVRWPREENSRPVLMHVAALDFHYGPDVAADRHSLVWFRELGIDSIRGPSGATQFLGEVFRDLWLPQMMRFVRQQILRRLVPEPGFDDPADMEQSQRQRHIVETWSQSAHPFSWPYVSPAVRFPSLTGAGTTNPSSPSPSLARRPRRPSPTDVVRTWQRISTAPAPKMAHPPAKPGPPPMPHGFRSSTLSFATRPPKP
jgi:hypothetical protein